MGALLTVLVKARRSRCAMYSDEQNIQLACVLVVLGFQSLPRKEQNGSLVFSTFDSCLSSEF